MIISYRNAPRPCLFAIKHIFPPLHILIQAKRTPYWHAILIAREVNGQKKRETGTGNCIPGRLSPFGIMQSYAGGKPCDQNINMLFYKHLAYCSV